MSTRPDLGRTILRNSLAATGGEWITRVLNFGFAIFAVRLLGEDGFGRYATVLAFVGLFGVFFELGLAQYVERTIAQDRRRAQELFWNLVVMRLLLALIGIFVITALAIVVGYDRELVFGVLLYTSTFVLAAFMMPLTTVLTANERFDISTPLQLINQVLTIVTGLILLKLGLGFFALLFTGFVAMPVQIALCIWTIHRYHLGPLRFQIAPTTWPRFIRSSVPFGLTSLALTFNFNVDTVMLGLFHTTSVVGWYNAAYRLVFNLSSLASGFSRAITPSLARENVTNPQAVRRVTRLSVQGLALVSLPAAVGASILAPQIISVLYGKAYAPAAPVLAVIVWDVPLVMFCAFCGNVTAAVGLERPASRIYMASTALNIGLNLLLIPRFGMMAAAVVTVITDGFTSIRFYRLLSNEMEIHQIGTRLLRTGVAALLMGVVVWFAHPIGLPLVILAGMVCYAFFVLRMRLIDSATLHALTRKVVGRVGLARGSRAG
jgi:O-antigen/teichoic acid export membrane protein